MASLAASLASKAMGATGLFSNNEQASSPSSNADKPPPPLNDVETDAGNAGSELIKTICATLNSPENRTFSKIVENSVKTYFSQNNPSAQQTILKTVDSKINTVFDSLITEESNAHIFRGLMKSYPKEYETWFLDIMEKMENVPEFKKREFMGVGIANETIYRISSGIVSAIKTAAIPGEMAAQPPTAMVGGKKRHTYKRRLSAMSKKQTRSNNSHIYNLWGGGGGGYVGGEGEEENGNVAIAGSLETKETEIKNKYKTGEIGETEALNQSNDLLAKSTEIVNKTQPPTSPEGGEGCDNLIDKIVAGKVLNDYEKMVLKYMDFRMKPNTSADEINSKIMFVVANAIDKHLSTDKFQAFLREHVQKELPGLINAAVAVYNKEANMKYFLLKKMMEDKKIQEKMVNAFIKEINELVKETGTTNTAIKIHNLSRMINELQN